MIDRKTRETDVHLELDLDGRGDSNVDTGIPFLDHMLRLLATHGYMDLDVRAKGDTEIDDHHTVEDLGICMGLALKKALGEKRGIRRYGEATLPMDETLVRVVMDICDRPVLCYRVTLERHTSGSFDVGLVREFFRALVTNAGFTVHVDLLQGDEPHHIAENIFKAFAKALDQACTLEERSSGRIPSTKGLL
jgi:imidazoleglycerol-phosphate dehydratase